MLRERATVGCCWEGVGDEGEEEELLLSSGVLLEVSVLFIYTTGATA